MINFPLPRSLNTQIMTAIACPVWMKSWGDIYQCNTYTSACIYNVHMYTCMYTCAKLRVVLLLLSKLGLASTGGRNIGSAIHTRCWPLLLDTLTDSSACVHPTLRPEGIMNWMVERPGNVVTCYLWSRKFLSLILVEVLFLWEYLFVEVLFDSCFNNYTCVGWCYIYKV